jgi:hypothetical protein
MLTDRPAGARIVIILENGSEWPAWLEELGARKETCVIAQSAHESLTRFAARVAETCEPLNGSEVELAAIGCSERTDGSAQAARRSIARTLGHVLRRKPGRLLITASERSSGRCRYCLSAFAIDLLMDFEATGVSVGVRFGGLRQVA